MTLDDTTREDDAVSNLDVIFDRVCAVCGLTYGSHRGDSTCRDQCPVHEGRMDWPTGGITTFVDSGRLSSVPQGTQSRVC